MILCHYISLKSVFAMIFVMLCVIQDGTVEEKVPSPELFPIHHLDELEFFPGDFVVDAKGRLLGPYR